MIQWLTPYLRQADWRWAGNTLGQGPGKIGTHGCTLTCLCIAAQALKVDAELTPDELNLRGLEHEAFVRDSAVIPSLAIAAGLQAPRKMRLEADRGVAAMGDLLRATIEAGWVALLRVDRDPTPGVHHHWVCALAIRQGVAICADPATGKPAHIHLDNLKGTSVWPSGERHYEVDAVVPVGPLLT